MSLLDDVVARAEMQRIRQNNMQAAIKGWSAARRALMRASADGERWTPELVAQLNAAERALEAFA